MAIGKCADCEHEMSTTAESCPNCGSTLPAKEKKTRLVRCHFCQGEGYYYLELIKPPGWHQVPGCSAIGSSIRSVPRPCSKGYPGAEKCSCRDGKEEEVYYE